MKWCRKRDLEQQLEQAQNEREAVREQGPDIKRRADRSAKRLQENNFVALFKEAFGGGQ